MILRQLGASEQLLDRLVAGDAVAVLTELKAQAQRGDPTAINVLGEIADQQCHLGRADEVLDGYQASQLTNAQALPSTDREWFNTALRDDIAFDKQMNVACNQVIDQDQVHSWVAARAAQGDGASLLADVQFRRQHDGSATAAARRGGGGIHGGAIRTGLGDHWRPTRGGGNGCGRGQCRSIAPRVRRSIAAIGI